MDSPEREAERLVAAAIDLGITLFDTARGYGASKSDSAASCAVGETKSSW